MVVDEEIPGAGLPIICLMGPTASGKTAVAVELCRRLPLDIISVDSAMVYRGLDIGTAKPGAAVQSIAPHRLIDICDASESYSAARFRSDALREITAIHAAGRIPLLVGGTGLYFRALERGLSELPAADPSLRRQIEDRAALVGWTTLHGELADIDPVAAARIHPNDPQRIQRALEVYYLTGKPLSEHFQEPAATQLPQRLVKINISPPDRSVLHQRIAQRFHDMLEAGFLAEVENLYRRDDLHPGLPSMRLVGYRQAWQYLAAELDYQQMIAQAIVATRQLAKRQLTWLRKEADLLQFQADIGNLLKYIEKIADKHG